MKSPRPVRRLRLAGAIAFTALASLLASSAPSPSPHRDAAAPVESRAALGFSLSV